MHAAAVLHMHGLLARCHWQQDRDRDRRKRREPELIILAALMLAAAGEKILQILKEVALK